MSERCPGAVQTIFGVEHLTALDAKLRGLPMGEVLAGDPEAHAASLAETLRQLPDSVDGWRGQGVYVGTKLDAQHLLYDSALLLFGHVARQPDDGFANTFLDNLERVHGDGGQDAAKKAVPLVLVPIILARTLNSDEASPQGRGAIGAWAAGQLDTYSLEHALVQVSKANLARVSSEGVLGVPGLPDPTAGGVLLAACQAKLAVETGAEPSALETDKARQQAEDKMANSLIQRPDKTSFWAGYEELSQEFPSNPKFPGVELLRQSFLFEKWRRNYIEAKRQAAANQIPPGQSRNPEALAMPEGDEDSTFDKGPGGYAVFPNLESLLDAMRDYYAPRNGRGELLMVDFRCHADRNEEVVGALLAALRAWGESGESDDSEGQAAFRGPLHGGLRGSSGPWFDEYQNTALEATGGVGVTRGPGGVFILNQSNVGLYAGMPLRFGDEAGIGTA